MAATTGTVRVPLSGLKTGNSLRDSHTKGALSTGEFPNATFKLDRLTGGRLTDGQTLALATTASGTLTVRGVSIPVSVPV
ncbi:YceI family protein [Deinococcus saxicola]|uniref:YceI family protein n=1 Tax=Deinococcus saxicola TaxID=249406 RepID=UPI003D150C2C